MESLDDIKAGLHKEIAMWRGCLESAEADLARLTRTEGFCEHCPTEGPCIVCGRGMVSAAKSRLEYLRGEIRAERISYGEIDELTSLAAHIEPGDVELLQWADVPEVTADAAEGEANVPA